MEVHAIHSFENLGESAEELHKWMDDPAEWAGYLHRFYRHNPEKPPESAVELYGFELSKKIMQDPLDLDEYEDYHGKIFYFLKALLINEIRTTVEKTNCLWKRKINNAKFT